MRQQSLKEEIRDVNQNLVWQEVVSFPLPVDANAFYDKQASGWRIRKQIGCAEMTSKLRKGTSGC